MIRAMIRKLAGTALAVALLSASAGTAARADAVAGWLIAGAVVNTILKGPPYDRRSDLGPRYGYWFYGKPGYLAPGYTYVAYDGPGAIGPVTPVAPYPTCYWTNRIGKHGLTRVRVCY